uniref:Uncharacterized protein n=1 Tax=Strombidium inclinatum TaxID=197538 RepID=A0A7S3MTG7_9SPIT
MISSCLLLQAGHLSSEGINLKLLLAVALKLRFEELNLLLHQVNIVVQVVEALLADPVPEVSLDLGDFLLPLTPAHLLAAFLLLEEVLSHRVVELFEDVEAYHGQCHGGNKTEQTTHFLQEAK